MDSPLPHLAPVPATPALIVPPEAKALLAYPLAVWQPANCPRQQSGMHVHVHILTMSGAVCKALLLQVRGREHEMAEGLRGPKHDLQLYVSTDS